MDDQVTACMSIPTGPRARWVGGLAMAAVATVAGGCQSSGAIGLTDCYGIFRLEVEMDQYRFHGSGVRAQVLDPDCPPLKKVDCRFWDDRDGDREVDPGEQLTRGVYAEANPPSNDLTSGAFSGRRAGSGRATCWECEVVNSSNEISRFGGTF